MTFDQCRYFLETAKFQHVGKAAKSLHISASAVSTAIAHLEEELGCPLFERRGQGIQLTERGQRFRIGIEAVLDQLLDLKLAVSDQGAERFSGLYRLAASPFLAARYLGKAWGKIQTLHPELSGELRAMATGEIVSQVLSGALDAGLCFSPFRHPDLKSLKIRTGRMQIAVRKKHPLLKKPSREHVQLLSQYPATLHKATVGVDLCVDHPMFQKFGITPKIRSVWDSDELAAQILRTTDAWSMLPDLVCEHYRSEIVPIGLPEGWSAPYSIDLVCRSHRARNPLLILLAQELSSKT